MLDILALAVVVLITIISFWKIKQTERAYAVAYGTCVVVSVSLLLVNFIINGEMVIRSNAFEGLFMSLPFLSCGGVLLGGLVVESCKAKNGYYFGIIIAVLLAPLLVEFMVAASYNQVNPLSEFLVFEGDFFKGTLYGSIPFIMLAICVKYRVEQFLELRTDKSFRQLWAISGAGLAALALYILPFHLYFVAMHGPEKTTSTTALVFIAFPMYIWFVAPLGYWLGTAFGYILCDHSEDTTKDDSKAATLTETTNK